MSPYDKPTTPLVHKTHLNPHTIQHKSVHKTFQITLSQEWLPIN